MMKNLFLLKKGAGGTARQNRFWRAVRLHLIGHGGYDAKSKGRLDFGLFLTRFEETTDIGVLRQ